jgi:hypothetical protein
MVPVAAAIVGVQAVAESVALPVRAAGGVRSAPGRWAGSVASGRVGHYLYRVKSPPMRAKTNCGSVTQSDRRE